MKRTLKTIGIVLLLFAFAVMLENVANKTIIPATQALILTWGRVHTANHLLEY